jgi:hypothetical protein
MTQSYIEYDRFRFAGQSGVPSRFTREELIGKTYELDCRIGSGYDLTLERQSPVQNILMIPGIANPVEEIKRLLFSQGQPGGSWIPTLSAAMIAANTFGSGVTDILDLSGNNNPFSQVTPASRGAWFREPKRGRVNLAIWTEDISNAAWIKANSTISANAAPNPINGEMTADALFEVDLANNPRVVFSVPQVAGVQQTWSIYAKANGRSQIRIVVDASASRIVYFTLSGSGTVVNGLSATGAISDVGNGWYRCAVTSTPAGTNAASIQTAEGTDLVSSGDSTKGVYLWGAQLELGSTATAYQRVTTAFDVTESGQRDCYGVRTDGVDDRYATAGNVNLSTTGQVTVWAALRSRTSSPTGTIFSTTLATTVDSFLRDNRLLDNNYGSDINLDDSNRILSYTSTVTKPAINVVRCRFNLQLSGVDRVRMFVDGVENVTVATFGTMSRTTFLDSVLHLFSRSNGTQPASVDFFGGIIAGGGYSLATEQRIDRILSRITPTVNL